VCAGVPVTRVPLHTLSRADQVCVQEYLSRVYLCTRCGLHETQRSHSGNRRATGSVYKFIDHVV